MPVNPVMIAEPIACLFLGISLYNQFSESEKTVSLRWLTASSLVNLLWLIFDVLSYTTKLMWCPVWMAYSVNFLAFTLGGVALIVHIGFCCTLIREYSTLDRLASRLPMMLVGIGLLAVAVMFFRGEIFVIVDGRPRLVGGVPGWVQMVQLGILVYLPAVAFVKRRSVGRRTVVLFALFGVCPVLAVIAATLTGFDYSVVASALSLVMIASQLQRNLVRDRLKKMNDALLAANMSKSAFLFGMSHDIRTPMNAIQGFAEIARKSIDDRGRVLDCLDKIESSGELLLSLINSILDMSRIESGNRKLENTPGDVRYSFANIEATMKELANTKGISLTFEFGSIVNRYVLVDYELCARVFVNIISNAIKYSKPHGWVRVRCEQVGENAEKRDGGGQRNEDSDLQSTPPHDLSASVATYRYTFVDNGIGMSEEFQKHVFEQFTRERSSTSSGIQGTGLGLALCKSFVDLMGGTIECKSKLGEGTVFTVDLPFKVQNERKYIDPESGCLRDADVGCVAVSESGGAEARPDLKGMRVLLVEDNALNREVAEFVLKENEIEVESAEDGAVAVRMVREKGLECYDYILMDIQMPIMGGYEATRAIRGLGYEYPIIALSANAFAEDREASFAAGMDDHIAKPIHSRELVAVLEKWR